MPNRIDLEDASGAVLSSIDHDEVNNVLDIINQITSTTFTIENGRILVDGSEVTGALSDSGTDTDGGDDYQLPNAADNIDLQGGGRIDDSDVIDTNKSVIQGKTNGVIAEVMDTFGGSGVGSFSHSVNISNVNYPDEFIGIEIHHFREDNSGDANVDVTVSGLAAGDYGYALEGRGLAHTTVTGADLWRLIKGAGTSFHAAMGRWFIHTQNSASGGGWPAIFGRGSQNHRGVGDQLGKGWSSANKDIGDTLTIEAGDGTHAIDYEIAVFKTHKRGLFV